MRIATTIYLSDYITLKARRMNISAVARRALRHYHGKKVAELERIKSLCDDHRLSINLDDPSYKILLQDSIDQEETISSYLRKIINVYIREVVNG